MALVLADRVKETTTTAGTGTVTLLGASTGFQSFAAIGDTNTAYYTIAGQTGSEWEVGIGTYTAAGTTLARTTVLSSSNAGSLVNFSAGTKDVFVTYPSGKSINLDASGNASPLGTPVAFAGTNITGTAAGLTSGITNALTSATTTISVAAATAPIAGQLLTATSDSAANWQSPAPVDVTPTNTVTLTNKTLTNPAYTNQTLTDAATIAWDMNAGNIAKVTIAANRTMGAPSNLKVGTTVLEVVQDATGSRLITWNAVFKWSAGAVPVLSTAANAKDVLSFYCDGTNLIGGMFARGYA